MYSYFYILKEKWSYAQYISQNNKKLFLSTIKYSSKMISINYYIDINFTILI